MAKANVKQSHEENSQEDIGRLGFKNPAQFVGFLKSAEGKVALNFIASYVNARELEARVAQQEMLDNLQHQKSWLQALFLAISSSARAGAAWRESYDIYNKRQAEILDASTEAQQSASDPNAGGFADAALAASNARLEALQQDIKDLNDKIAKNEQEQNAIKDKYKSYQNAIDKHANKTPEEARQALAEIEAQRQADIHVILHSQPGDVRELTDEELMMKYADEGDMEKFAEAKARVDARIHERSTLMGLSTSDIDNFYTIKNEHGEPITYQCPPGEHVFVDPETKTPYLFKLKQVSDQMSPDQLEQAFKAMSDEQKNEARTRFRQKGPQYMTVDSVCRHGEALELQAKQEELAGICALRDGCVAAYNQESEKNAELANSTPVANPENSEPLTFTALHDRVHPAHRLDQNQEKAFSDAPPKKEDALCLEPDGEALESFLGSPNG